MKFPKVALPLVASILLCTSAFAQSGTNGRGGIITVVGEASVNIVPDYVQIEIIAENYSGRAEEAHSRTTKDMSKAIEYLRENKNVTELKTTNIELRPRHNYADKTGEIDYYARQSLSFKLTNIQEYDKLMLGLMENGINGIGQVSFLSSESEKYKQLLLTRALEDALKKAKLMAGVYGQELGRAVMISDRISDGGPRPMMMEFKAASMDGPSVEPGTLKLTNSVQVQFELK